MCSDTAEKADFKISQSSSKMTEDIIEMFSQAE